MHVLQMYLKGTGISKQKLVACEAFWAWLCRTCFE